MRKETVISIGELRRVSIACTHCDTEVILDMAGYERKIPPRPGDRASFAPGQCPACKAPYDTAVAALEELHKAFAQLQKLEGVVSFHAAVEPGGD